MLHEFRRSLIRELDYRQEARNLSVLRENLAQFDRIVVPAPIEDYTTGRVLTTEYIRGQKVTSINPVVRTELDGAALAEQLFQAYLRQVHFYYRDHHGLVRNWLYKMLGNASDAADLAHDVFLRLLVRKREFESDSHVRAYLLARTEKVRAEGLDPDALLAAIRESPGGPRILQRFAELIRCA